MKKSPVVLLLSLFLHLSVISVAMGQLPPSATPETTDVPDAGTASGNDAKPKETPKTAKKKKSTGLKPLRAFEETESASPGSEKSNKGENDATTTDEENKKNDSVAHFLLAAGLRIGTGIHEQSAVQNKFDRGFALGPELEFRFLQFRLFRVAFDIGFLYLSHQVEKGTDEIFVTTKYNRLDTSFDFEFYVSAFFMNARFGAGYMITSTKSELNSEITEDSSRYSGMSVGFLGGFGLGAELGKHFFGLNREIDLSVQSDWMRHNKRDEITVWALVSVEIVSSKN